MRRRSVEEMTSSHPLKQGVSLRMAKYHRTQLDVDKSIRCVGKHCVTCWMLGREKSLYGDKIVYKRIHYKRIHYD